MKRNLAAFFVLVLFPAYLWSQPALVGVHKLNRGLDSIKRLGASYQAYFAKSKDGVVYGAYNKTWVGAYNLKSSKWLWFYKSGSHLSTEPVVTQETVSFALRDGTVAFFNRSSGALIWKARLPAFVNQPMVSAQGQLIVQTSESKTYALDKQTGDIVWVFESPIKPRLSLASAPAPIVTPALVFVGDASGFVYGLDRSSGRAVWRFYSGSTEAQFNAVVDSLHLDGTNLWIARSDGVVHKVDPRKQEDAAGVWTKKLDESLSAAKFSDKYMFLGMLKGEVVALNKTTGSKVWSRQVHHDIVKVHYLKDRIVAVGPRCETSILTAKSGKKIWSKNLDGYCSGAIFAAKDGFYIPTGYKNLYKVRM